MPTPVIMPKFGMTQEEGTLLRWHKTAGEPVAKGEVLLEVMTDKVDMEVEAPADGLLAGLRYGPQETVPVTTVLAYILQPGETLPSEETAASGDLPTAPGVRASPLAQRMARESGVDLSTISGSGTGGRIRRSDVQAALASPQGMEPAGGRVRATPAARRLARERGVELADVSGSGPGGRIQAADVQATRLVPPQEAVSPTLPAGRSLQGMRRTIAARLGASWRSAPHVTFTASIEMTAAEALQERLQAEVEAAAGARFTLTALLAKAVAAALVRHPRLNAWLLGEGNELRLVEHTAVHLGLAVALDDGLIVPVVHAAQALGLIALTTAIGDLSARARQGTLTPADVADGTFTLSNLGMFPVDHFTAIINPPQVAILAIGRAKMTPVWDGQSFRPASVLQVTLSADHRAVDGAAAAAFLGDLKRLLEEPSRMLL